MLLTGVAVAWFWPAGLAWTEHVPAQLVMALILFVSAWTLESRLLYAAVLQPWPALWALVISYGLLPALGWATGFLLPVIDFRIGVMLCASVPCTLASAVLWTRMAGGNEAVALLATFLTTGVSWVATTAWLTATTSSVVAIDTNAMMVNLLLILVAPVVVGQLARAVPVLRRTAMGLKTPLSVLARLLILVIMLRAVLAVLVQLGDRAATLGAGPIVLTAVLCLGNHLLALYAGYWSSGWLGFPRPAQIAVAFAGSQKTLPVSLALLELYFNDYPLAVVPLLFYHAGQLIADTFIAEQWAAARPAPADSPGSA